MGAATANLAPYYPSTLHMADFDPPNSPSSVHALLDLKRADNELSELERHLLLRTISLDRELEKRDKQHEAEKEELQKKLAKANRWSLASEREVERLLAELSQASSSGDYASVAQASSAARAKSMLELIENEARAKREMEQSRRLTDQRRLTCAAAVDDSDAEIRSVLPWLAG